jgi:hypothetical protein
MQGIFLVHDLTFPFGDVCANAALAFSTAIIGLFAYLGGSREWLLVTILFGIITTIYFFVVARMIRQFIRFFFIARRIARDEGE